MRSSRGKNGEGSRKKTTRGGEKKRGEKPKSTSGKPKTTRGGNTFKRKPKGEPLPNFSDEVRLNKYIANTGICSRREADTLIATGVVSVNGEVITEMGYKVKPGDTVKYDGESIKPDKKRYVLLNKPKDYVMSNADPKGRKSVMALIAKACKEAVFPVDKMDREAKGLLLCTNDGDLAKKLTHPAYKALQTYQVLLDKTLQPDDMKQLSEEGVFLDKGKVFVEEVSFINGKSNHEVGISIRSNKNKIVHRIFEKLGYRVITLDRVEYAGLTKKDLPRGHYRQLTEKEVAFLKMS